VIDRREFIGTLAGGLVAAPLAAEAQQAAKTPKALGLTIPPSLLLRADQGLQ